MPPTEVAKSTCLDDGGPEPVVRLLNSKRKRTLAEESSREHFISRLLELLLAMEVEKHGEHDLESVIIVLGYAVLRSLLTRTTDKMKRGKLTAIFGRAFGHTSLPSIIQSRRGAAAFAGSLIKRSIPS